MAVTIAAAWIMRDDDGTDESEFSPGDVVRLFQPPQSLIDNPQSTQQRCSLMIVTNLNLTDAQFLSMQHSVGVRHDDAQYNPYTPGTPEYRAWQKPPITTFLLACRGRQRSMRTCLRLDAATLTTSLQN
jgi:hypothetical protein